MEEEIKHDDETNQGKTKQWFQDNLRIIISILIVVVIAGGIYSYSKRTQAPTISEQSEEEIAQQEIANNSQATVSEKSAESKTSAPQVTASQETESAFVETAGKGAGTTVLARKALANYLEKNPDSSLTAEHKIYIEDYMRKHIPQKGGIHIGTSVEFSKSLVQDAITKSKNLNANQLKNLHKYAVRVPSLS